MRLDEYTLNPHEAPAGCQCSAPPELPIGDSVMHQGVLKADALLPRTGSLGRSARCPGPERN